MVTDPAGRNLRSVWTIATQPYPEAHFATFPEALVVPCVKAGSREGDTVLDPFAGSGTVVLVANQLGRHAIGIEANPAYGALSTQRNVQLVLL
jgi:DNA modification methylase